MAGARRGRRATCLPRLLTVNLRVIKRLYPVNVFLPSWAWLMPGQGLLSGKGGQREGKWCWRRKGILAHPDQSSRCHSVQT